MSLIEIRAIAIAAQHLSLKGQQENGLPNGIFVDGKPAIFMQAGDEIDLTFSVPDEVVLKSFYNLRTVGLG